MNRRVFCVESALVGTSTTGPPGLLGGPQGGVLRNAQPKPALRSRARAFQPRTSHFATRGPRALLAVPSAG